MSKPRRDLHQRAESLLPLRRRHAELSAHASDPSPHRCRPARHGETTPGADDVFACLMTFPNVLITGIRASSPRKHCATSTRRSRTSPPSAAPEKRFTKSLPSEDRLASGVRHPSRSTSAAGKLIWIKKEPTHWRISKALRKAPPPRRQSASKRVASTHRRTYDHLRAQRPHDNPARTAGRL
jgi:hypothetical protein